MSAFKEFAAAAATLLALLFVSNAIFGEDAGDWRFDSALYDSATYAPRSLDVPYFARDAAPAIRVRQVFAQFIPSDGKRGPSSSTVIR